MKNEKYFNPKIDKFFSNENSIKVIILFIHFLCFIKYEKIVLICTHSVLFSGDFHPIPFQNLVAVFIFFGGAAFICL
jgi:hypothetical protein